MTKPANNQELGRTRHLADDAGDILGSAAKPLYVAFTGDATSFGLVNAALAAADAPVNLNDQNLTNVNDLDADTITTPSLTSGRVVLAGAAGLLEDDAGLAYNKGTDALTVTGTVTATGDLAAAGGFRRDVGPWAGTTAADQTGTALTFGGKTAPWVAPRAGSIMGISAGLSAAITGASKTVIVHLNKNGALVNAALNLTFTTGGAETALYATATKDTYTFAAGDKLTITYDSTTITNTPDVAVNVEVEM